MALERRALEEIRSIVRGAKDTTKAGDVHKEGLVGIVTCTESIKKMKEDFRRRIGGLEVKDTYMLSLYGGNIEITQTKKGRLLFEGEGERHRGIIVRWEYRTDGISMQESYNEETPTLKDEEAKRGIACETGYWNGTYLPEDEIIPIYEKK